MTSNQTGVRIALQLYTVRAVGDLVARLELAKQVGYAWVETEALHGLSRSDFVAALQASGLRLASMHVEMSDLAERLDEIVASLKACACTQLVMPWLDETERPQDSAGWLALAATLQAHALVLQGQGITLAYHNHAFEFERLGQDGRTVLETLLEAAPSLRWQADVAWVARAGEAPMAWLERYALRLQSVHVKDLAKPGAELGEIEQGWATLGEGRLDWPAWLPWLSQRVNTFIVEHDQPSQPARTAAQGLRYLAGLLA
ncbi:sugar phosphate isomerase/epimerase family protein [Roseateles oligotrophus]|uniref:Sugar phosphate isomerase/epimerase n=1 Tax=Roseateles oligotrophus TaxID=1769250 RepID=A0ABT2YHT7_9BURK|nr:sugar phosphate isomerase/epimerase [Roseateles oligotrophus]MCV2369630.1 sugar phosphate isomerase/epimerase [Roseateles oligotrophus]